MPTKRAWIFLTLALVLYFLANQTQVGWLYIITDSIIGLLIVTFFYTRGMLNPIRVHRTFRNLSASPPPSPTKEPKDSPTTNEEQAANLELALPTFYEDDPIEVTLQFSHHGFRPALLISGDESCPFAPVSDQTQSFFIPGLFKGQPINLSYQTKGDRRGLYRLPKLQLFSSGPFGLFKTKRRLKVPGEILIYPQYYPLKRLPLLEQKEFAEKQARSVGPGSEIIGTREYRPGDSLRQIHWRSTAHTGKLVVKEFADSEQLTLTVVLDLEPTRANGERGKFSPFETAIRMAASFGYYATRKNIPFYLVGASKPAGRPGQKGGPPTTPLGWWAILNYLAKVKADGQEPMANVLNRLPVLPFVVVLVSHPTETIAKTLPALPRQGTQTLAIFITSEGALPPTTPALKAAGLEIKSASPHNWAEVLAEL